MLFVSMMTMSQIYIMSLLVGARPCRLPLVIPGMVTHVYELVPHF